MARQAWRVRRWVLRLSMAGSLLLGVSLVYLFAPVLGSLSNLQMLAMLGLVLLPAVTAWAVIADRRGLRERSATPSNGGALGADGLPAYRSP